MLVASTDAASVWRLGLVGGEWSSPTATDAMIVVEVAGDAEPFEEPETT